MANNSLFWNAYRAAVKNHLLPNVEPRNEVFTLPFTVPLTSATTPLTTEGVNYLIYSLANTTLDADGSKGNYANELNTYLENVDENSLKDPGTEKELTDAEKTFADAKATFEQVKKDAKATYDKLPGPKDPFEKWVSTDYPSYNSAERTVTAAETLYKQVYTRARGRIDALHGYQDKLKKALDTESLNRSYNMPVQKGEEDPTFKPYYSSLGLTDQLNKWIQGGGQEHMLVEVKVDSGTPSGGSVKDEDGIYLKLTTKGVGKFDLRVGQWDVPSVKTLYPKQKSGSPHVLDPKYALPISALVAYNPKLEVEIREGGQSTKLIAANATNDQPYVTVLGILGQHFPSN